MPNYGGFHRSWIQNHNKYKTQCNSLSAAWMIFISGGMKIAWAIYEQPLVKSHNSIFGLIHTTISWFIGVIVGTKFATMFVQRFSKNVANCISGVLVIISGSVFTFFRDPCIGVIVGRYIDGCAFGITILQAIVTGGEVSTRLLRGTVLSTERVFLWVGIFGQICLSTIYFDKANHQNDFITEDQIHGIVSIILGLLSLICTAMFAIESPVYLHINHRESESIRSLMKLQQSKHPTNDIFEIFDDNKLWIRENAEQSFQEEIQNGMLVFLKLVFLRSLVSLALSLPFHWAFHLCSRMAFDSNMLLVGYGFLGLLGSVLSVLFMDTIGRRLTASFSLCIGGTLLFAIAGTFLEFETTIDLADKMKVVTILLLVYQFINAFGLAPATTIYMSEAFALPLKSCFIAGIIVVDNLIQVITCVLAFNMTVDYSAFFFTVGVLNCVGGLVVVFWLPETKKLTLRECYHRFSRSGDVT
ncbi:glucose facilitated diffusion protein-like [Episyrphus balteatus]|uniref:glucose facilitated diffusion protein-like n=1 Tax=Episyrphus balteatus TaxID=286459 RepID=UPI002485A1D0|nr:glucose facilitated diffusion protein-like [Episyrphus balteatus]